ncbi:MAG: hypothetical protein QW701_07175 [Candidatus Nezhaarchaeales archaeon]
MRLDLLLVPLAYFFVVCIGVGAYLMKKYGSTIHGYIAAGGAFGWLLLMSESVLLPFGVGDTINVSQGTWFLGANIAWFKPFVPIFSLTLLYFAIGPWIATVNRRLGARTSSELLGKAYDPLVRFLHASISSAYLIALCAIEMIGTSLIIMAATGLPRSESLLLAAVLFLIYAIFAGVAQVGFLNLINIVVYYIGVILGFIVLTNFIAPGGGWSMVESAATEIAKYTSFFNPQTGDFLLTLGIPLILGTCGWAAVSHFLQFAFTAKDPKEFKKAHPVAMIINGLGSWIWLLLGFVTLVAPAACFGEYASSIEVARQTGDALGALAVTFQALPSYAMVLLLINVLVASLSTGGYGLWAGAMSFVHDIVVPMFPKMSEKRAINLIRVFFVIFVIIAAWAGNLPSVLVYSFVFAWSLCIPLFIILIAALRWKRNSKAALWTIISSWIVTVIWLLFSPIISQSMPSWLHAPVGAVYPSTIIGIIVYAAITLASRERKPSLLAETH